MIHDGDKRSLKGRRERLEYLLSVETKSEYPISVLTNEYYEEARLCWYVGAFVSTIIMVQLSIEELLRSHYRVLKGVNGRLSNNIEVNNASFFNLIHEAENDLYITSKEATAFNHLRKNIRNPFVHVKDKGSDINKKYKQKRLDFFTQTLKIVAPQVIGKDIVDDAKKAIHLLVTILPNISNRNRGL